MDTQICVPADHRQQVIEIVRHAAGQAADCFHFVCLPQALFQQLLLFLRALQRRAHAAEGFRNFTDFSVTALFQGMAVISFLQRAHAHHQAGQRACERVRDQENQHATNDHAEQSKCQQNSIEPAQKPGSLIERFQHA
jgi:hypothetical protein